MDWQCDCAQCAGGIPAWDHEEIKAYEQRFEDGGFNPRVAIAYNRRFFQDKPRQAVVDQPEMDDWLDGLDDWDPSEMNHWNDLP